VITVQAAVGSIVRILIVEDDPALRGTLADVLEDEGYEVASVGNGAEALAHLRRGSAPSVILLDLAMPVMDGWSFRAVQRRDARLARIPTVAVSASLEAGEALEELGVDAFLPKPFDLDELIRTVQRLCARRAAELRPARRARRCAG
jgi:CheY-like chemotaxis protein